jgi:hypothetical protein
MHLVLLCSDKWQQGVKGLPWKMSRLSESGSGRDIEVGQDVEGHPFDLLEPSVSRANDSTRSQSAWLGDHTMYVVTGLTVDWHRNIGS